MPWIRPADLQPVGQGLARPECVLADDAGTLFCSDSRGGVMRIRAKGGQDLLGRVEGLVPNGLAPLADGSFLIANVGEAGGVWHLRPSGSCRKLDIVVEGRPLPEVNFVHVDTLGRLWISVSSAGEPDPVFHPGVAEGVIVLGDERGFRVAARGLGWTNELRLSPANDRLYVNETFGRRLLQFDVAPDGTLSNRTVLAQFGAGDYPDGLALDVEGGLWVVSIISNRIHRVIDGRRELVFSDERADVVDGLERLLTGPGLRRADLRGLRCGSRVSNISSLAFGGPGMKTAFVGSLNDDCLWSFESPVAGSPQRHAAAFRCLQSKI